MPRIEIAFGLGEDASGQKMDPAQTELILAAIVEEAGIRFGGCNLVLGLGSWKNASGRVVSEQSAVLTIDGAGWEGERIDEFAHFVRTALAQDSVLVTRLYAESKLVSKRD